MILRKYASFVFVIAFSIVFNVSAAAQHVLTTLAGNGEPGFAGDGSPGSDAMLNFPGPLAVDVEANVYVADLKNHRIRKIGPNGVITTVAGNGVRGFSGDGRRAVDASLDLIREEGDPPYIPSASFLVIDREGNLFFTDTNNNRVRRVDVNGNITTVAGNGSRGYSGDDGPAIDAALNIPSGLALDASGNL
jgi:sugar lactone lactonase YvrE